MGDEGRGRSRRSWQRNYAKAGYDRTHIFQMGFVYELPFAQDRRRRGRRAGRRTGRSTASVSAFSGTPFTIAGDNTALNQQARAADDSSRSARSPARRATRDRMRRITIRRRLRSRATMGQHGPQLPARAGPVEPRPAVSSRAIPFGALSRGVPRAGDQLAEPHAMGQPGDWLYRSQLHADPQ